MSATGKKKTMTVPSLGEELFEKVQQAQGFAFISDGEGEGDKTPEQFFDRVRGRLKWTVKSASIIRAFLKKYGESYSKEEK